jgi:porin
VIAAIAAVLLLATGSTASTSSAPSTGPTARGPPGTQPANSLTLSPDLAGEAPEVPPAPDGVDEYLIEAASRPAGLFKYGPVSVVDPVVKTFNEAAEQYGLHVGLAYTVLYQAATGGPGRRDAAGGDIDLFGNWRLLGAKDDPNRGALYFIAENRHQLGTPITPAGLGSEVGSLWATTFGFTEQPLALRDCYWQQHFGGDRLIVRVGKLDPQDYYNSNYWQSDNKYFLNQAFSSFPVRAFPSDGLGVNVTAKPSEQWYVSAGVQDAQAKKTHGGFDTFFGDFNLFGAAEVGLTPTLTGLGRGTYRFTAWYRDAGETDGKPHDAGFDISIDQHIGPQLIPFLRYGIGEGNINGIEHMISAGVGWEGKLLTESDVLGLGGAWGRPSDHALDDQFAFEAFYRLQVSPDNQLTIGYQVIIHPTFEPGDEVVGVFELRWRITI